MSTETEIDFSVIEHLDFEPGEKNAEKCDGVIIRWYATNTTDDNECQNPAVLRAFRACCGHMDTLCRDCYNTQIGTRGGMSCRFCKVHPKPIPPYVNQQLI